MHRLKSPKQTQQSLAIHDTVANLFNLQCHQRPAADSRLARDQTFATRRDIAGIHQTA